MVPDGPFIDPLSTAKKKGRYSLRSAAPPPLASTSKSTSKSYTQPKKFRKAANPIDKLLKVQRKSDSRGFDAGALERAERSLLDDSPTRFGGKRGLQEEIEDEDMAEVETEDGEFDRVLGGRGSLTRENSEDAELHRETLVSEFGEETADQMIKLTEDDRSTPEPKPVGIPLWDRSLPSSEELLLAKTPLPTKRSTPFLRALDKVMKEEGQSGRLVSRNISAHGFCVTSVWSGHFTSEYWRPSSPRYDAGVCRPSLPSGPRYAAIRFLSVRRADLLCIALCDVDERLCEAALRMATQMVERHGGRLDSFTSLFRTILSMLLRQGADRDILRSMGWLGAEFKDSPTSIPGQRVPLFWRMTDILNAFSKYVILYRRKFF